MRATFIRTYDGRRIVIPNSSQARIVDALRELNGTLKRKPVVDER